MARDVEFNVTASDQTGAALNAAARRVSQTQKKIAKDTEANFSGVGKSLLASVEQVSPAMAKTIGRSVAVASEAAGPMLAAGVAAAAPMIGGAISAAIVGGAGLGGVAGGVALAARDPAVKAASAELGKAVMAQLEDSADVFVRPVLDSIDDIGDGFSEMDKEIRSILGNSARYVEPLTDGVVSFGQSMIRAFDNVSSVAGPTIDAIADGVAEAGRDLEEFLTMVAGDGEGAATAVRQVSDMFGSLLAVAGPVIAGLSEINVQLEKIGGISTVINPLMAIFEGIGDALEEPPGQLAHFGSAAADAYDAANGPAANYWQTLQNLAAAQRVLIGENLSLFDAQTQAAESFATATEAVKKHGAGMAENTKTGRANRETLGQLARDLNTSYDAYVRVHGAGNDANEVMIQNRKNFVSVATAATGSAAAANRLADEILGIPDRRPKIEVLDNATGKINNVINRMAAVRSKTVTIEVLTRQSADASALRKQSRTDFAASAYAGASAAADGAVHRTGGPAPISVSSRIDVALDGTPFRSMTARAVTDERARQEWRQRVGRR